MDRCILNYKAIVMQTWQEAGTVSYNLKFQILQQSGASVTSSLLDLMAVSCISWTCQGTPLFGCKATVSPWRQRRVGCHVSVAIVYPMFRCFSSWHRKSSRKSERPSVSRLPIQSKRFCEIVSWKCSKIAGWVWLWRIQSPSLQGLGHLTDHDVFIWQRRNADCQPIFACQEGCKKLHIVDVWTSEPASLVTHLMKQCMNHEHKLSIAQPIWFDMQWHLPGAWFLAAKMRFTLPGAVHVCP